MDVTAPTPSSIEEHIGKGQLVWALAAMIIGMPASWKTLGLIGRFMSRRFDNRDHLVEMLVEGQAKEHEVRMAEASALKSLADAQSRTADAIFSLADSLVNRHGDTHTTMGYR
jgi:hypothetical protein